MKKAVKLTVISIAVVALLVLIVAFGISPFAKYYIEKNSKELIGRQLRMADLKANIFTGSLEIDSLKLYELNDKELFVTLDTFKMNLEIWELLSKNVVVKDIRIIAPTATIWQQGEVFNFSDLMAEDTVQTDTVPSEFPKLIILKNIYIAQGQFKYTDKLLNHTMRFNELGVNIPELQFGSGNTKAGVHLKIGDQAELNSRMEMNMQTSDYKLFIKLNKLPINIIKPYLKGYYDVNQLEGTLNSDIKISGNTNHLMSFIVSGKASIHNVVITNKLNEPVISGGDMAVDMKKIDLANFQFIFNSIHMTNVGLNYIMHPTTDNITELYPATTDTTSSSSSDPMVFKVDKMLAENTSIRFEDKTLRKPYELLIKNAGMVSENFDLNGTNQFKGEASLTSNGKLNYLWKGNINDLSNQEIILKLINFDLKNLSPYSFHYTAYDLVEGNLRFETKNKITNNNIVSSNTIDVYKVNVSKKHKEYKPEYNLPLRTALYILKDKNDKINFVVPVKGNINDPEFKYWRIVFKTLGNLMVKVVTSPFKFMGDALGLSNKDGMSSLPVSARNNEFTANEYAKIDELLSTVAQKPAFNMDLIQYVDMDKEIDGYDLFRAKEVFLTAKSGALTFEEVDSYNTKDSSFVKHIDSLSMGKIAADAILSDKIALLYPKDSLRADLLHKMKLRNSLLEKYILNSGKLDAKKIQITNALADSLKDFSGKAQYKIKLKVDGDE